jgi:hypothetical protein
MLRRTVRLLDERQLKAIQELYIPNDKVLENKLPYELRGQNLPRTKLNPFKKAPLRVIYDPNDFGRYVLPSQRDYIHHSK